MPVMVALFMQMECIIGMEWHFVPCLLTGREKEARQQPQV